MIQRKGMGKGLGTGYKNIIPRDSYIHGLSAKGVRTYNFNKQLTQTSQHMKSIKKKYKNHSFDMGELVHLDAKKKYVLNVDLLKDGLPHGSGIDADWNIEDKGSYFKATNSYHAMDDVGYYIGWQDFEVIIPKKDPNNFKLHFTGDQYVGKKSYGLRDYLEDTLAYSMDEMKTAGYFKTLNAKGGTFVPDVVATRKKGRGIWTNIETGEQISTKDAKRKMKKILDAKGSFDAGVVLQQLGGNKFIAMTGAKDFIRDDNTQMIGFKIGRNSKNVNYVKITLNPMDTYDVEFLNISHHKGKLIVHVKSKVWGIYNDQLQDVFTTHTGMHTSLYAKKDWKKETDTKYVNKKRKGTLYIGNDVFSGKPDVSVQVDTTKIQGVELPKTTIYETFKTKQQAKKFADKFMTTGDYKKSLKSSMDAKGIITIPDVDEIYTEGKYIGKENIQSDVFETVEKWRLGKYNYLIGRNYKEGQSIILDRLKRQSK